MPYIGTTPIIPNTTMQIYVNSAGVQKTYRITPNEGYVMHDNTYDEPVLIPETAEPTGEVILGYRPTTASVALAYDFSTTETLDEAGNTVLAYGSRQLYTKLATDVPENQIFGVSNGEHEIMWKESMR